MSYSPGFESRSHSRSQEQWRHNCTHASITHIDKGKAGGRRSDSQSMNQYVLSYLYVYDKCLYRFPSFANSAVSAEICKPAGQGGFQKLPAPRHARKPAAPCACDTWPAAGLSAPASCVQPINLSMRTTCGCGAEAGQTYRGLVRDSATASKSWITS